MSQTIEFKGVIKGINPPQTRGAFTWSEVILETDGQYPQTFCLQFSGARLDLPQSYKPGMSVKIDSNIRGREVEKDGKLMHFINLPAWRITKEEQASATESTWGASGNAWDEPAAATAPDNKLPNKADDVPF